MQLTSNGSQIGAGSTPLRLGQVIFQTQECPEQLSIGAGEQMIVTHNLPGGGVVTNAFGHKPHPLTFTGRFFDKNIAVRVAQLNAYKVSGQEILLSYGSQQYYCRVKEFDPGYRGGYNEYSITLEITRDANGAFSIASATTIDQQVAALQNQINTQYQSIAAVDPKGSVRVGQALTNVNASLLGLAPLAQALVTNGTSITAQISSAISIAQTYQASLPVNAQQSTNAIALVGMLQVLAGNINRGQSPASLTTIGGSLFTIASTQYGNPAEAFTLAMANGLIAPFLSRALPTTLALPALAGL